MGRNYTDLCYADKQFFIDTTTKALLNQTYSLTVVAKGIDIYLYINKRCMRQVQDNSASSGKIGLMAFNSKHDTHVCYRNIKIWDLTKDDLHFL